MRCSRFLMVLLMGYCVASFCHFPWSLEAYVSPASIAAISFEGNRSISAKQLKSLLQMSLEGREYAAESLRADLQRVEQTYQDEGFLEVKIGSPEVRIQTLEGREGAVIRIPITEGPRYTVGKVSVKNAQVLAPETLMQMCPLQKGQPYSRVRVLAWQSQIEEAYRELGYIRIRCDVHEALNKNLSIVDCALECTEGKAYSVGTINLVGDKSIDRLQFKRRLLLGEGGIFNPEMISLSIHFINQMHLYRPISNSDVEMRIDDAKGTVDLTWHLFLSERREGDQ